MSEQENVVSTPPRFHPWVIEGDPDYRAWLTEIESRHPRHPMREFSKARPGSSTIGRSLVLAERDQEGRVRLGVQLNTGDEFWKAYPDQSFDALLDQAAAEGTVHKGGEWIKGKDLLPAWLSEERLQGLRLEFCSGHVGGFTQAVARDGASLMLDSE